jgi:hypothetical protein
MSSPMTAVIEHRLRNRSVHIDLADGAPEVTGQDTRGREQTIIPARLELSDGIGDYEDFTAPPRRVALITGRYTRDRAMTSAVYRTIRIRLGRDACPDWVLALAELYLPEETS